LTLPIAGQSGAKNGEWTTYGADLANTRYSPLNQISAENFSKLEVAWRFKTESLGPRPEFNFESTPLMARGVVYSTAGTRRAVVALDAANGELLWMHSEREGAPLRGRPASSRAAAFRTGPMAARNGFSTSRPGTGSSRSMQRPACRSRASARLALSI
jgi:quinoprotein glucose dehydrogenase